MGLLDRTISLTLPVVPKPVVRFFSRPYIAGATVEEAMATVRELAAQGALSTLDILGEFVTSMDEANAGTDQYIALVRRITKDVPAHGNISVKLSALGLLLDSECCLANMRRLMRQVDASDRFVRIDMEDSTCTDATLEIYRTLREEFGDRRVGVVLQSRLRRSLADTEALARPGATFRLCKGIYIEPESIAHVNDQAIRDSFLQILDRMFALGAYVGIATHDEWLVDRALELVAKHGLGRDQYEFQMLLGVLAPLRRKLIADGHKLRVYVPFGQSWYAYSVRRLRENPQIAGHVVKALFRRS
jgi:proline dehydrogenase